MANGLAHLRDDFNIDGRSDVVFRDNSGDVRFLLGTNAGGFTEGATLFWNPASTIVGTGDFNGDGRADLLLSGGYSDTNGSLLISVLNTHSAGFQPDWEAASIVPSGWTVAGTGDFNGDGKTDVLLRHADGRVTDWLATAPNATIVDVPDAPFASNANFNFNPGTDWHIAGTGDFNGDGRDDILWRNDSGTVVDLLGQANGSFISNANFNLNPGLDWHVVGTGDFNGDGRDDILWRSDNGTVVDLLGQANGSFVGNVNLNLNPGLDWHVAGTGDYNGDGFDDILWRNDIGTVVDLLGQANGAFVGNVNLNLNVGSDWQVQPEGSAFF